MTLSGVEPRRRGATQIVEMKIAIVKAGAGLSERVIAEIMGWEENHVARIIRRYVGRSAATQAVIEQMRGTRTRQYSQQDQDWLVGWRAKPRSQSSKRIPRAASCAACRPRRKG